MAFEHLCGQVMTDSNGTIYIISDNFSVIYPGDAHPDVYEWADISAVKIDKSSITVTTGKQTYHIPDRAFTGRTQFTAAKTLILSQVSDKETVCDVSVEVLPVSIQITIYPTQLFSQKANTIQKRYVLPCCRSFWVKWADCSGA